MARRYTRDNRGRFSSTGATARGGRLRTAAGNKRKTQTAIIRSAESKQAGKDLLKASQKSFKVNAPTKFGGENQGYATPRGKAAEQGRVAAFRNLRAAQRKSGLPASGGAMRVKGGIKRDPGAAAKLAASSKSSRGAAKPVTTTRKEQLAAGAQRRNAQANRIDAKVKALEGQYRSKDAAFYTQGAKPAGRDRMIAKSQQAAQLREQSAALRTKAANAEKMSTQTKGTAASKKQERRNDFDAAGYKVGDTVTTRQFGTQKITKISKNSVSFDKGNAQDKAFMANYLQLQAKPANPVSTARQAATDRLKVKTQTRRAIRADRSSVVTPGQRSRLETGKGSTRAGARPASTVAKPRTTGNTKPQVASRVERKLAAERAKMNIINRAERFGATQGNQREWSYKREATLKRAQTFLKTGKLPGKDNSIAAQRSMRQAKERLAAKNAARAAAPKPAAKPVPKSATSLQAVNARRARASAPRTSTYLSQKLNTQSAITRSAANAIYNRQRAVSKAGGLDKSVVRNPIGIMPKTSGSVRNRASQVREAARKRVVGGRRR
jgi:hypothetical protein